MKRSQSESLKKNLLLAMIVLLIVVLCWQLVTFMPGMLGAITLYILMREHYFRATVIDNRKKWLMACLFILLALIIFVLPIAISAQLLMPKFYSVIHDPEHLSRILNTGTTKLQEIIPQMRIDEEQIQEWVQNAPATVPGLLGATISILANLALTFFLLYFMLIDGRKMERQIQRFLPLREENIDHIWVATRTMVISNAIGIPVLALSQAIVAGISYSIFGIPEPVLWAIVTGIFSILPFVGSAVVWLPISIYLLAIGQLGQGIGLLLYSVLITGSIDNILRFTLLKKLGDVHPVITVFGIIVGVPLFGFMGLIFGPLLISYLLLLVKIYRVEFSPRGTDSPAGTQFPSPKKTNGDSNDFLKHM